MLLFVVVMVDISVLVMVHASGIVGLGLPNAPLDRKYDNHGIER